MKAHVQRPLADGPLGFGQLRRALGRGVSQQVLSAQLKGLAGDRLVERRLVDDAQPSLYALSGEALTLIPILDAVAGWGADRLARDGVAWPAAQGPLASAAPLAPAAP